METGSSPLVSPCLNDEHYAYISCHVHSISTNSFSISCVCVCLCGGRQDSLTLGCQHEHGGNHADSAETWSQQRRPGQPG